MSGILSIWKALSGTMNSFFNIGGTTTAPSAVRLKANAGALDVRSSSDSGYANARVADPVVANDAVNFEYANKNYLGFAINVPTAASYTITGTDSAVRDVPNGLFATKSNRSNAQCDTFLQSGGSFPSTGWSVELWFTAMPLNDYAANYPLIGVCVASGLTGADSAFSIGRLWQNSSNGVLPCINIQAPFHPGSTTVSASTGVNDFSEEQTSGVRKLRLLYDGNLLFYQFSWDGYAWYSWTSGAPGVTISYWGFCIGNGSGSGATGRMAASIYKNILNSSLAVPQVSITNVTNSGGNFQVTAPGHGAQSGDVVTIHGVTGSTGINTIWVVKVIDANNVLLPDSTFAGSYVSGGILTVVSR